MSFIIILLQNETHTFEVNIHNDVGSFYSVNQFIFPNEQITYGTDNACTYRINYENDKKFLKSTHFLFNTKNELTKHLENFRSRFPIVKLCLSFCDGEVAKITDFFI